MLFGFALLSACSTTRTPTHAQAQTSASKNGTHTVAKGETLFSIAWTYGLDYKSLAKSNGIDKNYTIYPGQVLRLDGAASSSQPAKNSAKSVSGKVADSKKIPQGSSSNSVNTSVNSTSVGSNAVTSAASSSSSSNAEGDVSWIWPAKGAVMQHYSESGAVNKGIDIAGNSGDPVVAAASGKVVYAGNGLLGYGQLIIIKHNDQMLSAYAHNRVLLVKEGDDVTSAQKIAEVGATGTDKVKLHFEIRHDGKPVDPEKYLPRR
jgi:lipoprotein NlpD